MKHAIYKGLLSFSLCAALTSCHDFIETPATTSSSGGKLFYSQIDHRTYQGKAYPVVTMDLDGTNQHVIGQGVSLSAAAGKILYVAAHGEFQDSVVICNDDGSSQKTLLRIDSDFKGWEWIPVLSPDGSKVLYGFEDATHDHLDVKIQDVSTGMMRTIDYVQACETVPCFSSDGKYVVYYDAIWKSASGNFLKIASVDGSGTRVLTSIQDGGFDMSGRIAWRPGTQQIAYFDNDTTYLINSDGSGKRLLVNGVFPVWSADGSRLAYTGPDRQLSADIFVTSDLGATSQNVTNTPNEYEAFPQWAPDGRTLYGLQWTGDYDHVAQSLVSINIANRTITPLTTPADYLFVTK